LVDARVDAEALHNDNNAPSLRAEIRSEETAWSRHAEDSVT